MAPVPTATLNAGDSTPKLGKASLILATEAINELYSFMDPDTDSSIIAFTRNMTVAGTLNVTGAITGSLTGNASSATLAAAATKLATARTLSITGDATWTSGNFDGTANVSAALSLAAVGTPVSNALVKITTDTKGRVTATSAATASDVQNLVDSVYVAKTGSTMTGNLTIQNAGPVLVMNSTGTGQGRYHTWQTAGVNRWVSGVSSAAETGSNVGSNFFVQRYDDSGNAIDSPLNINRQTGATTLNSLVVGGGMTTNALTVSTNTPAVVINTAGPAQNGFLTYQDQGLVRWRIIKSSATESGSNVGSDLSINRYDDTGAFIDTPFTLTRSSGLFTFRNNLTFTGNNGIGLGTALPGTATSLAVGSAATVSLAAYHTTVTHVNSLSDLNSAYFNAVSASTSTTDGGHFRAVRARGTVAAPTAVASGDLIGTLEYAAHDGSSTTLGASINGWVDTYTAATNYSTMLSFATRGDGAGTSAAEKMRLDKNGYLLMSDQNFFQEVLTGGNASGIQIAGTSGVVNIGLLRYTTTQSNASILGFSKIANNTAGTTTAVSTNDLLGVLKWSAADGANITESGRIHMIVNGTVTPGVAVPADMVFQTLQLERMRINSAGSVGINTATPGNTQTASAIQTGNSTLLELYRNGVSAVTTIGDSGSGLYLAATYASVASTLSIFRGSKARGTMAAPTAVASGDAISTHQGSAYDGSAYQITSSMNHGVDTFNAAGDIGGYISLNTRPTGVGASLTERLRVSAAGNVFIGATAQISNEKVLISQTSAGGASIGLRLHNTGTTLGTGETLAFSAMSNAAAAVNLGYISAIAADTAGNGIMQLATGTTGTATVKVTIDQNGLVGVGTTSPSAGLEVIGSVASRNTKTANTVANSRWFGGAYTGNLFTFAALDGSNGNNNLQIGGGTVGGEPATQIQFYTGPAGTTGVGTQRMAISSAGVISDSSGNELGWKDVPPNTTGFVRNGCYCVTANTTVNSAAAGTTYELYNDSAVSITLSPGTGVTTMRLSGTTSTGARTILPYGKARIWFRDTATPVVSGDVL